MIREHNSLEPQSYTAPAERQEFKRLIEEKGVVNNFEFEVKRKDGSTIWVSENARIVRDAAGNALYYEGSVRDITERKRSELVPARERGTPSPRHRRFQRRHLGTQLSYRRADLVGPHV